jgi:deoxyribonuclease V
VVYDLQEQRVVEEAVAWRAVRFPYVPGLLTFREAPAVLAAARRLITEPDLFMFDGHGYAHPRRFGLATHTGMLLGKPSVGCAKTRLCGQEFEPVRRAGATAPLIHQGQTIGALLRTQARCKPVYVSIGNAITLDDAIAVVMASVTRYRLPEPTRLAHQLVTRRRVTR